MFFLDLIFPDHCLVCSGVGTPLCQTCANSLPVALVTPTSTYCLWHYRDPRVRSIIFYLKRKSNKKLYQLLADLLTSLLLEDLDNLQLFGQWHNPLVTSIPLTSARLRKRGFNQSHLLAQYCARKIGLPYTQTLKRTRSTHKQALTKNRTSRHQNIHGVFSPRSNLHIIQGRTIIIIDDVLTTGATTTEAARVLMNHGAKNVLVLTVAH